jgi:hypothetical protein
VARASKASPEVVEKRRQALELRKGGQHYPGIAESMGCALSTAHGYVQDALTETLQEPADEVRELELTRLDMMIRTLWPTVLGGSPSEKRNAIDRVIMLMDRRAKYLGLDAPQRRIVEVTTHDEFSRLIKELEVEIGQLEGDGQVEGETVEA